MLYFVQQFPVDRLQIDENRLKFCNLYNIDLQMRFIPPVLLYRIQHLLTRLRSRSCTLQATILAKGGPATLSSP